MSDDDRERTCERVMSRRRILQASTAASIGLAGCLGDDGQAGDTNDGDADSSGSDGGDGGDGDAGGNSGDGATDSPTPTATATATGTPTDSPTPTATPAGGFIGEGDPEKCSGLTQGGYERREAGEGPFVVTFEYLGSSVQGTGNTETALTVRKSIDGETFDMFPYQRLDGKDEPTDAMRAERDGLSVVEEFSYQGETIPVVKGDPGADDPVEDEADHTWPYYFAGIPHEHSAGTRYYRFGLKERSQYTETFGEPVVCPATWELIALDMIRSVEPNPETTIEEYNE
jgi:hypothetical protein